MTTQTEGFVNLLGVYKQKYAPYLKYLVPESAILVKLIKFSTEQKVGDYYNYPVNLALMQGITAAGGQAGNVALNASVAQTMQNAKLFGSALFLTDQIDYSAAYAAMTKEEAFDDVFGLSIKSMKIQGSNTLEILFLYGSTGYTQVASVASSTSTTAVLNIVLSQYSAAILYNIASGYINFYNGSSLISSGSDSVFQVTGVSTLNPNAPTLTVTGTSTGITALAAALPGTLDVYRNGFYGNEMAGLKKIYSNTGSLFNIDASVYDLWRGNTYTVSNGQLVRADINAAIGIATSRGLAEDVVVLVNPVTFETLNSTESSARVYTSDDGTGVNGFDRLEFYAQCGKMKIVPHLFVKQGDFFIVPLSTIKRVGSTDLTMAPPGGPDTFMFNVPGFATWEIRMVSNQAILSEKPAWGVYGNGIVN